MRFGNPFSALTVNALTPSTLLGPVPTGGVGAGNTTFTLPSSCRSLALYTTGIASGVQVKVTGVQSNVVYLGGPAGARFPFPTLGEVQFRVEPTIDTTIRVDWTTAVVVTGTLLYCCALTDPGAVGVFNVPSLPPVNAVPPNAAVASGTVVGVGSTVLVASTGGGSRIRLWDSFLSAVDNTATQFGRVQIQGSPSGLIVCDCAPIQANGGTLTAKGLGGGVFLPANDGINLVATVGANVIGVGGVVYESPAN